MLIMLLIKIRSLKVFRTKNSKFRKFKNNYKLINPEDRWGLKKGITRKREHPLFPPLSSQKQASESKFLFKKSSINLARQKK